MLKNKLKDERLRGSLGLFTGRSILFISSALLGVFIPIFLYNTFNQKIHLLLLFYLVSYFLYGLLAPLGARFLNSFGFKKALILSTVWGALVYVILYLMQYSAQEHLFAFIAAALLFGLLFQLCYWLPYHIDFAKFTDKENRGARIGFLFATLTLFGVVGPVIAGYTIERFGFDWLFIATIILFLLAAVPFSFVPRTNEVFSWGYIETLKKVFSKENRNLTLSLMASGAEDTVGFLIWPIFIFLLLDGNYLEVGAVSGFVVGATVLFQLVAGKYIDKMSKKDKVLRWGTVLYSIGWVIKIFVVTAFHVFIAGLYQNLTKILTRTSFDTIFYELVADKGHYVDEYTVLREVAIQTGRVLMILVIMAMITFVPLNWTFLLAAGASMMINYIYAKEEAR